jgi:hypothetical protein
VELDACMLTVDAALPLRALEVYEVDRIDVAEADPGACAEAGMGAVASFYRSLDGWA